jgi:hypothetical protein
MSETNYPEIPVTLKREAEYGKVAYRSAVMHNLSDEAIEQALEEDEAQQPLVVLFPVHDAPQMLTPVMQMILSEGKLPDDSPAQQAMRAYQLARLMTDETSPYTSLRKKVLGSASRLAMESFDPAAEEVDHIDPATAEVRKVNAQILASPHIQDLLSGNVMADVLNEEIASPGQTDYSRRFAKLDAVMPSEGQSEIVEANIWQEFFERAFAIAARVSPDKDISFLPVSVGSYEDTKAKYSALSELAIANLGDSLENFHGQFARKVDALKQNVAAYYPAMDEVIAQVQIIAGVRISLPSRPTNSRDLLSPVMSQPRGIIPMDSHGNYEPIYQFLARLLTVEDESEINENEWIVRMAKHIMYKHLLLTKMIAKPDKTGSTLQEEIEAIAENEEEFARIDTGKLIENYHSTIDEGGSAADWLSKSGLVVIDTSKRKKGGKRKGSRKRRNRRK